MKIHEMTAVKGDDARWTTPLTDSKKDTSYEMAIRGPKDLVASVFEKSDFEIEIDPDVSQETARKRMAEWYDKHSATAKAPYVDPGYDFFKKPTDKMDQTKSIIVSTHRTKGKGTAYFFFFPFLVIPAGIDLYFILPPVVFCLGGVLPIAGDADLYLTLNSPLPPAVASSRKAGTAIDAVTYPPPLVPPPGFFTPFFRVNGYTTGISNFVMAGS